MPTHEKWGKHAVSLNALVVNNTLLYRSLSFCTLIESLCMQEIFNARQRSIYKLVNLMCTTGKLCPSVRHARDGSVPQMLTCVGNPFTCDIFTCTSIPVIFNKRTMVTVATRPLIKDVHSITM